MSSVEKLSQSLAQIFSAIGDKSSFAIQELNEGFQTIKVQPQQANPDTEQIEQPITQQKQEKDLQKPQIKQQQFQGLDQLQLIQSRAVANANTQLNQHKNSGTLSVQKTQPSKKKRIKEIEEQKRKIAEQLRELDEQIQVIKGKNVSENVFKKYQKIHRDQSAQKQAEMLVKELKNQRKEIEQRKRQQFEKSLLQMQKEDEQRRRLREEELLRAKEERRLAILQRMEQQKKRRQQRRMIEAQSNQLIAKLKKQEQLQKIASLAPSQIVEVDQRKRALEKKNIFNLEEIQEHDRKYRQLKQRSKRQKQQRAQSLKVHRQGNSHKFARNVWIERIEQEQQRKKQEDKINEERKRIQLEKRLKYGQLVKNIFLPKRKDKQNDHYGEGEGEPRDQHNEDLIQEQPIRTSQKPRTPQELPSLPKVKTSKNRTQNSKLFRQQSLPGIKQSKNGLTQKKQAIKQFDPDQQQKEKLKKMRQNELRKQTKQRLKKLQNQNLNKAASQEDRVKYKNYLGEVKIKRDEANDWKKIIKNEKLTEEQKYQQIIKKAGDLQARAKKKEDRPNRETDEDAVNLYIGSIQAKLALLQKF